MVEGFEPISEADARERIKHLQNLNTEIRSIGELKEEISTRGLRNEGVILDEGTTIYRARTLEEQPAQVSDLSYPPEDITGLNRANRKHDPMFYASSGAGATVFELDPDIEEKVAILKWRTTEEITLNTIGYNPEVLRQLDSSREENEIPGDKLADDESRGNFMMRKYFSKLFTKRVPENEKHRHKLTAAIAENWRSGPPIDGIMYPTVRMWGNQDNLAIETEVVDKAIEPISAEFIEMQGKEDKEIEKETLDTCTTIENDELQWNGHGYRWELENDGAWAEFEVEGGSWKVGDSGRGGATPLHDPNFEY